MSQTLQATMLGASLAISAPVLADTKDNTIDKCHQLLTSGHYNPQEDLGTLLQCFRDVRNGKTEGKSGIKDEAPVINQALESGKNPYLSGN
nr:hypothetical protein [Candidatus Gracilibacteria bacterium]